MFETIINAEVALKVIQCNGNGKSCSGVFAINEEWYLNRRKFGGLWYCPCCGASWIASENIESVDAPKGNR